jgi:type II secretory pathway pseudopilin PulG
LIELLVVIAIIGILAGLLLPAIGSVRNNAKKSKASSECQSLKTAIIMFESEYSCWPTDSSITADKTLSDSEYDKMCDILVGDDTKKNPKKIVFYEVGMGYKKGEGIRDPWGNRYKVILDGNFDGKIDASVSEVTAFNAANGRNGQDLRVRVGVYSRGVVSTDNDFNNLSNLAKKKKTVTSW